jgi:hypothetical protein
MDQRLRELSTLGYRESILEYLGGILGCPGGILDFLGVS